MTSTLISRGRRGTIAHPRSFCVACVALGDIHLDIRWQACHELTATVVLRGRRGTYMKLGGALDLDLGARDARDAAPLLRGRRGTW